MIKEFAWSPPRICFQFVLAFQAKSSALIAQRDRWWGWGKRPCRDVTCVDHVIVLVLTIVFDFIAPTPIHCSASSHSIVLVATVFAWFMAGEEGDFGKFDLLHHSLALGSFPPFNKLLSVNQLSGLTSITISRGKQRDSKHCPSVALQTVPHRQPDVATGNQNNFRNH